MPTPAKKGHLVISQLFFADDFMIFTNASIEVAGFIKKLLLDFRQRAGLGINRDKSRILFSNCDTEKKSTICSILGFDEHFLPVTYLGLPLFSAAIDCQPLLTNSKEN